MERPWTPPCTSCADGGAAQPRLTLYNSLVDRKVPFVPAAGADSKQITWYTCGPTVYDSAHVGHARNYLSFDIVRRVLEDYFGYCCLYVMNVTDVDDKIILRARRNHLLAAYAAQHAGQPERVAADCATALRAGVARQAAKAAAAEAALAEAGACGSGGAERRREELATNLAQEQLLLGKLQAAAGELAGLAPGATVAALLAVAGDSLAEALDRELGATVTDPAVFRAHAAKYEAEFLQDMAALGCRPPTVLTRVSEYIPEIVAYVERIVANGMGYAANGSVYFDTQAFRAGGHTYGKLNPWAVGAAALAGEAGGDGDKKHACDFALWKAAKPGEPFWDSPWGRGRPGWHIECSAMASAVLGAKMDIHTGGEDLRFPHHDNELAQAEAFYHDCGCQQWVNYFLHSGHLGIEGLKMSKSLKNFITIRQALESFTPRQLRLMFVLQPWEKKMNYGEQAKEEMRAKEALLRNFFANVDVVLRAQKVAATAQRWEAEERALQGELDAAQRRVHEALCDNINTQGAMGALCDLVRAANVYMAKRDEPGGPIPQPFLLRAAAAYVTRMLSVFGLAAAPGDFLGFADAAAAEADGGAQVSAVLDTFCRFRDEVRGLAKAKASAAQVHAVCMTLVDPKEAAKRSRGRAAELLNALAAFHTEVATLAAAGAPPGDVLAACDRVRDEALVELGVRLEDKPDGSSVWKPDDPAVLRAEQAERRRAAAEARGKKLLLRLGKLRAELDKFRKLAALPPVRQALADKYSRWDEASGEPTHDREGAPLEGKALDKARKEVEKQRKVRAPLEKKEAEAPGFLGALSDEADALAAELAALGLLENGGGA